MERKKKAIGSLSRRQKHRRLHAAVEPLFRQTASMQNNESNLSAQNSTTESVDNACLVTICVEGDECGSASPEPADRSPERIIHESASSCPCSSNFAVRP